MSDPISINGNQMSWASTSLKIGGEPWYGITSINYADKRERVKTYGMGRSHAPRGRTAGKYTVEPLKIKMFKADAQKLREYYAGQASDGKSYGNVELPWVLQYVESGVQQTVEFDRVAWGANTGTDEESAEALTEELEFDCFAIRRNGLTLFDSSEAGA